MVNYRATATGPTAAIAIAVINAYFEFFDFDRQTATHAYCGVFAVAVLVDFLLTILLPILAG